MHAAVDIEERSNLTRGQLLIWTGQHLNSTVPLYNMALAYHIDGPIDPEIFGKSFQQLIERCDALRIVVRDVGGVPIQQVRPIEKCTLSYRDLTDDNSEQQALEEWMFRRCRRPFDLSVQVFDSVLVKLHAERFVWYLAQHHIVTDGWSCSLLYEQMQAHYQANTLGSKQELSPLPSYASYVELERRHRAQAHFIGAPPELPSVTPPLELYGQKAVAEGTRAEHIRFDLGQVRFSQLRRLTADPDFRALTDHMSRFSFFATVLFAWLGRISSEKDLTIGALTHNRYSETLRRTIGLLTEALPLSVRVDPQETFRSLFAKVRIAATDFLRFATPGASTFSANRSYAILFNYVTVTFGDFCGYPTRTQWLHPGHIDREHVARIQVHEFGTTGRHVIHFELNEDVFDLNLRQQVTQHYLRIADAFLSDPDQEIRAVDLLSDHEFDRLTRHVTAVEAERDADITVVDLFERHVHQSPSAIALQCGEQVWTYADVNLRVNRMASALRCAGVTAGSRVGVCLPRSRDAAVCVLAIMKSGGVWLPVDPTAPVARIEQILRDAAPALVITHSSLKGLTPRGTPLVLIDDTNSGDRGQPLETGVSPGRDHCAYLLYTSGSTGQPKGVAVRHGALVNYLQWAANAFVGHQQLAFPLFTNMSFDLTLTSILLPLTTGGRVVVYPEKGGPDLAILDVIDDNAVDIIKLTPAHLAMLGERELAGSRVRQLILGGEDLKTDLARQTVQKFGGNVTIHNEYGPTEATVGCVQHTFDPEQDTEASVPIGRPIDNMQAYVLNDALSPCPQGVTGELFVAGEGLAIGYWNQPELTAERFLQNPLVPGTMMYRTGDLARMRPCGTIEYLGRRDQQVKIRGARIELGEIEGALATYPGISTCVVDVAQRSTAADAIDIEHCQRCGLPSNYPGTRLVEGVCQQCRGFDRWREKAHDYFKSTEDLRKLFADSRVTRAGDYDCVALLSGGKDSTYALCRLVDLGLDVLAFTLDNGYLSDQATANIERVARTLGVDHMYGSTPAMNEIFVDSLKRHANVCHGCFKTIYTLSMQVARQKKIPFIVTGLSRGQFFETRLTEELFATDQFDVEGIDRAILEARKAYHQVDDAPRRLLDTGLFEDDRIFDEVRFIDFYRYSDVELDEMLEYLDRRVPWIRPTDTGRSTNCLINDVGIQVHKLRRGYHNYALPYSWDVRMGHKTREAALAELEDEIDTARVEEILEEIGFDEPLVSGTADKQLVAWYTAAEEASPAELREHLEQSLPEFMIPARFVRLDELPLTGHGKVDRAKLPRPENTRPALEVPQVAPRTRNERLLAELWAGVLGIDSVGIKDHFIDLGGDSITAIQIVARANRAGLRITVDQLFDAQCIEALARLAGEGDGRSTQPVSSEPNAPDHDKSASSNALADLDSETLKKLATALHKADRETKAEQ